MSIIQKNTTISLINIANKKTCSTHHHNHESVLRSLSRVLLQRLNSSLGSSHEVSHSLGLRLIHSLICLYQESIMPRSRFLKGHATSDIPMDLGKHNDLLLSLNDSLYYRLGYFFS